jgi:hypothetical protein
MRWFRIALIAVLALAAAVLLPALRAETASASPVEQGCRIESFEYSPGKTPEGFSASATDGCHTYRWTSNTVDMPGSGTVTFKTVGNVQPWEPGYTLPGPQGGNYCQYRAAHEANLMFTNGFKVPVGTEVTVSYRCY